MALAPPQPSNLSLSLDRPAWCPRPTKCTTLMAYEQAETQKPRLCVGRRATPKKTEAPSKPDTHNVCFPEISHTDVGSCDAHTMTIAVNQADMSFFIGLFYTLLAGVEENI